MTEALMLKLKSTPCQIKCLDRFMVTIKERCALKQDTHDNILISLTEAVNNAIIHGNKNNANKFVNISCSETEDRIVIKVSDEGRGFDHQSLDDPTKPENLQCCGGRGVFIMKQLSDEIRFLNNGRTIEMHFNLF